MFFICNDVVGLVTHLQWQGNGWSTRFEPGSCSYCPMIHKMDLPSNITWQTWQAVRGLTDSTAKKNSMPTGIAWAGYRFSSKFLYDFKKIFDYSGYDRAEKKKFPFKPKILRLELWSVSKWFLSKWPFLILMKSPFRSKNKTNYKADFSRWRNQSTNVDNASFFIEFHDRKKVEVRKQLSRDQTLCTAIHGDIYTAFQWQT